ncbi:histidine--tRNA ligase [Candidatus Uhrbacteria bacterium RIFOXYB12_FULL_58_10]|uniref:Histidine--tRNA ligase n=1 Tax=Candidatus Uhrbacteria bacterium RIFOXYB2_FULL_57_15 TaxID=1802422 RepID=A0A1F7W896_9BACT|nr:MAG: histidine--tRNA ligase [Candidatus Uhrbacteria bacterium RIFOXYB12_FULL_58_10]OGL98856.1 MAG: histidine--tRNA ligase [Candidatus Uhrbacteria bacterium RIFOXYB2_FULL_57_15]OGM00301.1 MAG: histidine--tRNA ligase [Candidatus Uhrbacteria bacterium RIFOXYC12_FULL_57_11]
MTGQEVPVKKGKGPPELLRGFRDVLPEEQGRWAMARDKVRALAEAYSFDRIELPILERADLFQRTLGKQTDVIEKEMYAFEDPSGDLVAMRPEATASVARAYVNHGMLNLPQPVKLWYEGPMFRHDRPQAGRFRQFNQFGFESLGVPDPIVDAQLILIASRIFQELGVDVTIQINSIGTPESRQSYLAELTSYFRPHRNKLSEDDKRRLQKNPLRLLDSKDPALAELLGGAPQIVDWLDEDSKQHFMKVLEYLDEVGVTYQLNPHLVRGLDYYTRTVFEIWEAGDEGERSQNALGGGGRYDGLVELIGGRPTPACGFAIGMERIVKAMADRNVNPEPRQKPLIFFAQLGDAARRVGLRLFEEFRAAGIPVAEAFGKNALKTQLDVANKLDVSYALLLGQKEVLDGTIIVRDMESGAQEIVDSAKIVSIMQRKLSAPEGVSRPSQDVVQ